MTTEERLENLERELARAKRVNRWVLAAVGLAFGVWTLAVALGPSPAGAQGVGTAVSQVRARKFVLVDAAGKIRAELGVDTKGPILDLFNAAGKSSVELAVTPEGSGLYLNDAMGNNRVALGVTAAGSGMCVFGSDGRVRWKTPG